MINKTRDDLLACNVVLLPSLETLKLLEELVVYDEVTPFTLNARDCLTHITISMGVIQRFDIFKIGEVIQEMALTANPMNITISEFSALTTIDGYKLQIAMVQKTAEIEDLHISIRKILHKYLKKVEVTCEMFSSPAKANLESIRYVQDFEKNIKSQTYDPHITFGQGVPDSNKLPLHVKVDRIALCALGPYCTSTSILFESPLGRDK